MTRAFIGLGGNLGDCTARFDAAQRALDGLERTRLTQASPRYRTAPVGDLAQPDFLNAVVEVETGLTPRALLRAMQRIENRLGRRRDPGRRWGPRTLDLDLLLFGHQVIHEPDLIVPHPRMDARAFVLMPLYDLAPRLEIPGRGRLAELLEGLDCTGVERVAGAPVPESEKQQ